MNYENERKKLVLALKEIVITTPAVERAFLKVPREEFLPERCRKNAYDDTPLPLFEKQTISQPYMIARMTELLDVKRGQNVLEIGSGSGYQAAILAELVGKKGKVITVERKEPLRKFAADNLHRLGYGNVDVILGDGTKGYERNAPYDRIMVTAAAPKVPQPLEMQLDIGGKMVIPVGGRYTQTLVVLKKGGHTIKEEEHDPCIFVPLIGKYGWRD